ncbi:hypothetical protein ACERJO_18625 [Halalkalibacter sp. AB-rgal2]|uniref:hypothetical protein n=1 Tax=Halalkalibacter sp. AB-rgal2 TaxID=3242695 RepID=UPI00359E413D
MEWVIGIALGVLTIIWLAMEFATYEDNGEGFRSYFLGFKKYVVVATLLFAKGGILYYGFLMK